MIYLRLLKYKVNSLNMIIKLTLNKNIILTILVHNLRKNSVRIPNKIQN